MRKLERKNRDKEKKIDKELETEGNITYKRYRKNKERDKE